MFTPCFPFLACLSRSPCSSWLFLHPCLPLHTERYVDCVMCHTQVDGAGLRALSLSVPELQERYAKTELAATVQCSGNRRIEMKALPAPGGSSHKVSGLDWDVGAIGTALWGGVLLRDVLLDAGMC